MKSEEGKNNRYCQINGEGTRQEYLFNEIIKRGSEQRKRDREREEEEGGGDEGEEKDADS